MESFAGDTEGSTEQPTGRKKSRFTSLKTRLFSKKKEVDGASKFSQSASDITAGEMLGSEEYYTCSQETLGYRALSHDSIFLADDEVSDPEPARVTSQENVHSKIKTLQMKLQQQKMYFGPPPLLLPSKQPGSRTEDNSLCFSAQRASSKAAPQPASRPLSPTPKPSPARAVPSTSPPSTACLPVDFSSPAQFTPCLDTTAARHRMSVKPRNQRASTKRHGLAGPMLNSADRLEFPVEEEEELSSVSQEISLPTADTVPTWRVRAAAMASWGQREPASIFVEPSDAPEALKSPSPTRPCQTTQQRPTSPVRATTTASPTLGCQPQRPAVVISNQQPPPVYADLKENAGVPDRLDVNAVTKSETGLGDVSKTEHVAVRSSISSKQLPAGSGSGAAYRSVLREVQGPTEAAVVKQERHAQASVSFRCSSSGGGGAVGPRGVAGEKSRAKTAAARSDVRTGPASSAGSRTRQGQDLRTDGRDENQRTDAHPRGGGEAAHAGPVLSRPRRDTLRKPAAAMPSADTSSTTGALGGGDAEESRGGAEDTAEEEEEEQEEGGKTAFGVKLRSTSLSLKRRPDPCAAVAGSQGGCSELGSLPPQRCSARLPSKPLASGKAGEDGHGDASHVCKDLLTNSQWIATATASLRNTDPALPGLSTPLVKQSPYAVADPDPTASATEAPTLSLNSKDVDNTVSAPQQPESVPQQTAPSEVSWMSLAMEKTRSLQQLLTNRLPRDFKRMQASARPQTPAQSATKEEAVTQPQVHTGIQSDRLIGPHVNTQAVKQVSLQLATSESMKQSIKQFEKPSPTVKQSLPTSTVQQKISTESTGHIYTSRVSQTQNMAEMSKESTSLPLQSKTNQPNTQTVSQSSIKNNLGATPSVLSSSPQMENTPRPAQEGASRFQGQTGVSSGPQPTHQQAPWYNRVLLSAIKPNSLLSVQGSVCQSTAVLSSTQPPIPDSACGERSAALEELGPSTSVADRQAVWQWAEGEKAAFIGGHADGTPASGSKVELKKAQSDAQTIEESSALLTPTLSVKDTRPERGRGVKLAETLFIAELSSTKAPGRFARPAASSSSPSSSPISSSPLQSMSGSSQPAWMDLAKRKSMAWSDKTVD